MLIILVFFSYIGSVIGKSIFYSLNKSDFSALFHKNIQKYVRLFFVVPIIDLILIDRIGNIFKESSFKPVKLRNLNILNSLTELLSVTTFFFIGLLVIKYSSDNLSFFEVIVNFIFNVFIITSLLYIAIYDLLTLTISTRLTKFVLTIVVVANLAICLLRLVIPDKSILDSIHLGYSDNLLAGIGIAIIMWLIVKITKERGMGEGDIDIMLIIGLSIGWPGVLISYLSTLFVASIISLIYAVIIRKFRGVIVPLVPFILAGYLIALVFGAEFARYIMLF